MCKARFILPIFAIICLCVFASTIPAYADSQPVLQPTVVGQAGGVTNAVAYYGSHIYFNIGPRLASMAVTSSQPDKPFKPERYGPILPGVPQDIKIANGYLYLALGNAGVAVVNPDTLGIVSYVDLPESAVGDVDAAMSVSNIAVGSRYLYGAAGSSGILVFDLGSNKHALAYVQTTTFANPTRNITDVEFESANAGSSSVDSLYASANNNAVDPSACGGVLKFDVTNSSTLNAPVKIHGQIDVNALQVSSGYVYAAGADTFYVLDTAELAVQNGDFPLGKTPVRLILRGGRRHCVSDQHGRDRRPQLGHADGARGLDGYAICYARRAN